MLSSPFNLSHSSIFPMLDFCHEPRRSEAPAALICDIFVRLHYIKPGDSEPGVVGDNRAEPGVTSPVFSSLPNIRSLALL
jgi:hypothetical protein